MSYNGQRYHRPPVLPLELHQVLTKRREGHDEEGNVTKRVTLVRRGRRGGRIERFREKRISKHKENSNRQKGTPTTKVSRGANNVGR